MIKKIFVFFMVLFGVTSGAWANDNYIGSRTDPNTKQTELACVLMPDNWSDGPYAVYFDTGRYDIPPECESLFAQVRDELSELHSNGEVSYFVVVASADQQGDERKYDNVKLSKNRYKFVIDSIMPSGAKIRDEGWAAGSATGRAFAPSYTDNWMYRSVYIYPVPVWNEPQEPIKCDQAFLNSLNKLETSLNGVKTQYNADGVNYENKATVLQKIDSMLGGIAECKAKCPRPGETVWDQDDSVWVQTNCIGFGAVFTELIQKIDPKITITIDKSTEIDLLYANLKSTIAGLKLNVWRDENGKFNTARLISDATAGVVLGTVGGIITAKVVKKNQLKKGFEDINCSVGGQNSAKYGDQMRVGL